MTVRDLVGSEVKVLGTAKLSVATAATANFDFGTPDDINLAKNSNYRPGDRILAVFDASTAGTTNTISFSVQDAPDSSGSIGTPAMALTDGTLTGGTGDQYAVTGVQLQAGRPWLRFRATGNGTTDTFVCQVTVLAVPRAMV
ncbi:MAG TPA: hypothetical protein VFW65_34685 [Pseudonocardiaceae bacterium]|nr:hypothetical protein [Pseudonocardiaceae bacterium]